MFYYFIPIFHTFIPTQNYKFQNTNNIHLIQTYVGYGKTFVWLDFFFNLQPYQINLCIIIGNQFLTIILSIIPPSTSYATSIFCILFIKHWLRSLFSYLVNSIDAFELKCEQQVLLPYLILKWMEMYEENVVVTVEQMAHFHEGVEQIASKWHSLFEHWRTVGEFVLKKFNYQYNITRICHAF